MCFFVTLGGTRASCVVVFMGICFCFLFWICIFFSCDFCVTVGLFLCVFVFLFDLDLIVMSFFILVIFLCDCGWH